MDANEADLTLHVLDHTPPGPFWKRNCPVRPTVQNLFKTCSKVTNPKPLCRLVCWSISITASSTLPLFQQTLNFFANDVNQTTMIRMGNKIVVIHTKLTKIFANFICCGLLTNSAHKDLLGFALPAPE